MQTLDGILELMINAQDCAQWLCTESMSNVKTARNEICDYLFVKGNEQKGLQESPRYKSPSLHVE